MKNILVILALIQILINGEDYCDTTECFCSYAEMSNSINAVQYKCPSLENELISLTYQPDEKLDIFCKAQHRVGDSILKPTSSLNYLPEMKVHSVFHLQIDDCDFEENEIERFFKRIDLNNVTWIDISNGNFANVTTLTFLDGLQILNLRNNNLKSLNLLNNINGAKYLHIYENTLTIRDHEFADMKELVGLRLDQNDITELPESALNNLKKLRVLHLFSNKLIELEPDVFADLKSLMSLELANNLLVNLSEDLFANLKQIERINLSFNNLSNISGNIFRSNLKLKSILLQSNRIRFVHKDLFAKNELLEDINLSYNNIDELHLILFRNLTIIESIDLSFNSIRFINPGVFWYLNSLKILNLRRNSIAYLPNDLFLSLTSLNVLNLGQNLIEELREGLMAPLSNLTELYLYENLIKNVSNTMFGSCQKLEILNMDNNFIVLDEDLFTFDRCDNLRELHLQNNSVQIFATDLVEDKEDLHVLNLAFNRIKWIRMVDLLSLSSNNLEIDLSNNKIETVFFNGLEPSGLYDSNDMESFSTIYLENNPIHCDCSLYDLLLYSNNRNYKQLFDLKLNNLSCSEPAMYRNISVTEINAERLVCEEEMCPDQCRCFQRVSDSAYIVDCAHKTLVDVPIIMKPFYYNAAEVYLQGNNLSFVSFENKGYDDVEVLNVSSNKLEDIEWINSNLKEIYLDNNLLRFVRDDVLQKLNTTTNITLHRNPWSCDCTTVPFSQFLRDHNIPGENITCNGTELNIKDLNEEQLCPSNTKLILIVTVVFILILTIIAVSLALYLKYENEIKVWMYAHKICMRALSKEDEATHKLYDAFLCYSSADAEFVETSIVRTLELCPEQYKICTPARDWLAGDMVPNKIVESIDNSRRTIIVVSDNFLGSTWGHMEFCLAHCKTIKDGRLHIIVIMLENLEVKNVFNKHVQLYLTTHSYIRWGTSNFWKKLKYALPHKW